MECNACQLEMSNLLSGIPSKWRDQLVKVICDKIVNQGVSCQSVMECLSNEMVMIDPGCLTDTQAEWDNLTAIGKIQLIVDKLCETLDILPVIVEDTFSISLSGDGSEDTPLTADLIKDPDSDNILSISTTGVYVPPTIMANSTCITWGLSTADGKRTYTPTLDLACITADVAAEFTVEADNGLSIVDDVVYLGGTLLEATVIEGVNNSLSFSYPESNFVWDVAAKNFYIENSSVTTKVSADIQTPLILLNAIAEKAAYNEATGYTALALSAVGSTYAIMGNNLPVEGSATPAIQVHKASYIRTIDYKADIIAPDIQLLTPQGSISAGTPVSGRSYRITAASGGANFVPSGALSNTVGSSFTANGVVPTWGTGSLEPLGTIYVAAPGSTTTWARNNITTFVYPDTVVNDLGTISVTAPGYFETQTYFQTTRDTEDAYITETQFFMKTDMTAGLRIVSLGTSVPTSNYVVTPAPDEVSASCYTQWVSDTPIAIGHLYNHSSLVSFYGIATTYSGDARVGINATTATNPLDIDTAGTGYSLRIRKSKTPASSGATGVTGEISWDSNYVYVCIAPNTWKRTALSTW